MSAGPVRLQVQSPLRFLITGAARGLGRGLSRLLVAAGHDVYLLDNNAKELEHTLNVHLPSVSAEERSKTLGRYAGTVCDIADANSVRRALQKARQYHRDGKIDVLINNAGRATPFWQSVESLTSDLDTQDPLDESERSAEDDAMIKEWRSFVDINLTGAFLVTRLALGMLRQEGKASVEDNGRISPCVILISSARAKQSEPNQEPYAATKAGLLGLNHALASSLHTIGVRSNAILPGWFPSDYESSEGDATEKKWSEGTTEKDHSQHWSGRAGRIEDLHNAVMFLATTRFVDGEEVVLDGGMSKKMQYLE